jgi:hypothetical protein
VGAVKNNNYMGKSSCVDKTFRSNNNYKKMNFSKSRTLKILKELANCMLAEETGLVSNLCKRQFFIKINAFSNYFT